MTSVAVLALAAFTIATGHPAERPDTAVFAADHHMHISSPAAADRLSAFCKKTGRSTCKDLDTGPSFAADALHALDEANIERGVLLSTAYIAGSKEIATSPEQVTQDTRSENTFVVQQAKASRGRLVAFISVNPLLPNALDEIAYWQQRSGATGLKLHLANSDVNFHSAEDVRKLADVFRAAARAHFPIIIHLRNRSPQYGADDADIFIHQVLPAASGDVVQIAHAAGWGGVDDHTLSALGAFADAFKANPTAMRNVYFDLAMVPDMPEKPATAQQDEALVSLMRQIGVGRFVLASDWMKGIDLAAYYRNVQAKLPLSAAEWRTITSLEAPYLRANEHIHSAAERSLY